MLKCVYHALTDKLEPFEVAVCQLSKVEKADVSVLELLFKW